MMEYTACNLCGNTNAAPVIYTLPDFLLHRDGVLTTLVKCTACGLVYQNPRPTFAEMTVHYPSDYESYAPEPNVENSSWLLRQAIRYGVAKRCRYITRYKRAGRLLDIGCATGIFLQGIRNSGNWEPYGVEINQHAAHIAQEHGLDVRLGTLEQAGFADEFFDVVTLWDVLEHLHDPAGSLREIHRILKPDGLLVIRVPNANSWDSQLFGRYWAGLDSPRHLYVFTPITLDALLAANYFQSIARSSQIGGYPTFLLSLRFWSGAGDKPSIARDFLIKFLYHPVMRLLSAPFFYLRGLGLRGPLFVTTAIKTRENIR
jgi:SAM-dependent methyltransferase